MVSISRSIRSIALASAAALVLGAPLRAQSADAAVTPAPTLAPVAPAVDNASTNAGPVASSAAVAVRRANAETPTPVPAAGRGHDRGTALMIVGGAAVLTGIVIGNGAGYAISVGGAVIGLYGLYLYLQ